MTSTKQNSESFEKSFQTVWKITRHSRFFCQIAHKHQTRDDGITPYWKHPVNVQEIIAKATFEEFGTCIPESKLLIVYHAALLHDVLEDTSNTISDIRTALQGCWVWSLDEEILDANPEITVICNIVLEVSTDVFKEGVRSEIKDPETIERIQTGCISYEGLIIKLADRLSNLRDAEHWTTARRQKYANRSVALLSAIDDVVSKGSKYYQNNGTEVEKAHCEIYTKIVNNLIQKLKARVQEILNEPA